MNIEDMFKSLKKYSLEKPYLNTEMGQYAFQLGFEEGDKCASKNMIEKACEWLKNNFVNGKEIVCDAGAMHKNFKYIEEIIPSFIKAMKE